MSIPSPKPAAMGRSGVRTHSSEGRAARTLGRFALFLVVAAVVALISMGDDLRAVLGPAVVVLAAVFFYLVVLTKREGHLPIFEAATFFVLATAVYTTVPLVQFVMAGMQCLNTGDYRMYAWGPTPQQFGGFAWRHVLLLTTFVVVYLLVRGRRLWPLRAFAQPPRAMMFVIVALVVVIRVYFFALDIYLGPRVSVYEGGTDGYSQLPLFAQQITNVLQMMMLTLKQCLVIVLLTHWRQRRWRFTLLFWLAAELALTVVAMESRTGTVMLLLTLVVGYHHVVRPIRIRAAFMAGGLMLASFLVFGLFRDMGVQGLQVDRRAAWGSPTEFFILYGNAYDIHMRKQMDSLPPVPPFLKYSDLYRLVPSQILPFYKWDPAVWYKNEVMLMPDSSMGFMFGIVAQSVLGHDWVDLFIWAILLAFFYAVAHRVWRRYSGSFWATITYLFILTWAYYAFRHSSFEILYRLAYYLAPTAVVVKLLTMLVSAPVRLRRRKLRTLPTA